MPVALDVSQAPVLITTAVGILTDAEYAEHLAECTELIIKPGKPYAYVYDGTEIVSMPSSCRRLQANWINDHRPIVARLNRGCGFAFSSGFTRGLLTAVHWISPPPYPHAIFATRSEAIDWTVDQLVRAGDLPASAKPRPSKATGT